MTHFQPNAKQIRAALRDQGGLNRRLLLAYSASLASLPLLGRTSWADPSPKFSEDPFTLGIASGDPNSTGMVLWTKLAPQPMQPFGGMPANAVEVRWEIASDESMNKVVASGTTVATPQLGHSVHVEVDGLSPDHWYWYRFTAGDAVSPIGRTRTMPAMETLPEKLQFAFASCQNYEQGLFTAYEQMAEDELDLVFHLGDYIYEYEAGRNGKVRTHHGKEIESLEDYRIRHNQYRGDAQLQAMHARCPWLVTWDDHEFDNNCAADISEQKGIDVADFLIRRANAYQAYYEMMPLRTTCLPQGPEMQLYRTASFGRLANFQILDTRQYRSDQPNNDRRSPLNEAASAKTNTLLGDKQKNWLGKSLLQSEATWNVLAQQVMMGMVGFQGKSEAQEYSMDQWPGYNAERRQLLQFLTDRRVANPIVLTGDIHCNWVNNLRLDDQRPETPVLATEFVGTSISSGGNGAAKPKDHDWLRSHNPGIQFYNRERGYVRCTLTPENWVSDYVVVDDVLKPGGTSQTRASFVVESGRPGAFSA
ncbi:Alkaline phosphatase D precursor [Roseimaritima multifibrata]|uniref:Alkaline phosphatase D n=1 Tax=Roseimaritima multifibrata TaxID=1930274 RepID=A0A517MAR9_9BACT|nr:alkaline phosphatase D family protein [Roseimaritima multifibrata]QDS91975.1 Alkaline phosphatase D precursor [Roseimaritima multifibrata]